MRRADRYRRIELGIAFVVSVSKHERDREAGLHPSREAEDVMFECQVEDVAGLKADSVVGRDDNVDVGAMELSCADERDATFFLCGRVFKMMLNVFDKMSQLFDARKLGVHVRWPGMLERHAWQREADCKENATYVLNDKQ